MKNFFLLAALIVLFQLSTNAQLSLPEQWKFRAGDDPQWSQPSFDDTTWDSINPLQAWESQLMPNYNGYGWYRTSVFIPAALKDKAEKFGGLMLNLGKIDDVDMTWFNGQLIGTGGKFPPDYETAWDQPRNYRIGMDQVLWDQYNSIAVRVFDSTGGGGLYGGPVELNLLGLVENIQVNTLFAQADHIIKGNDSRHIKLEVSSLLKFALPVKLQATIVSDFGEQIADTSFELKLKPKAVQTKSWMLPALPPGFYTIRLALSNADFVKRTQAGFGVDPEKIVSPRDARPDFDTYWQRAKTELAAVDPQFRLIRKDSLCTETKEVYLVEMRSLGNVLVRGWYSVPAKKGVYPAVLLVQGYSSTILPEYADYGDDIIGFGLNIRGHGNSKDNINPGFPGYLQNQLHDKEQYIYRGAYMDCVRAVDFLFSRPEVDTTRVAVEGGSQGGALTFATAALNNQRIVACVPQVPFLSDFPDYFKVARWPGDEFTRLVEEEQQLSWEQVFNTLSYIDIKNLAPMIKAPMLMAVGLVDDVCPPHINFAAWNQVQSPKSYLVYPEAGHGLPQAFHQLKMDFIRQHFGMEKKSYK